MNQLQQRPSEAVFLFGMQRYKPDFECPGKPKLPVARRVPKWHTAPQRRWLVPALRNQAMRHFRSVPEWHQNHDPKVATLCQILAFFYDDVTSHARAAGQPPLASALARNRSTPARERGVEKCMTGSDQLRAIVKAVAVVAGVPPQRPAWPSAAIDVLSLPQAARTFRRMDAHVIARLKRRCERVRSDEMDRERRGVS